jgi:predicted nucleic acid-binding Zn ribbon protein
VEFSPVKHWQKFCSTKCRMDHATARRREAMKLLGDSPIPMSAMVVASVGAST